MRESWATGRCCFSFFGSNYFRSVITLEEFGNRLSGVEVRGILLCVFWQREQSGERFFSRKLEPVRVPNLQGTRIVDSWFDICAIGIPVEFGNKGLGIVERSRYFPLLVLVYAQCIMSRTCLTDLHTFRLEIGTFFESLRRFNYLRNLATFRQFYDTSDNSCNLLPRIAHSNIQTGAANGYIN